MLNTELGKASSSDDQMDSSSTWSSESSGRIQRNCQDNCDADMKTLLTWTLGGVVWMRVVNKCGLRYVGQPSSWVEEG